MSVPIYTMCYRKNTYTPPQDHTLRKMKATILQVVTWHKTDYNKVWNCVVKIVRAVAVEKREQEGLKRLCTGPQRLERICVSKEKRW